MALTQLPDGKERFALGQERRKQMRRMDHRHLNFELPELAGQIPTCENVARVIWNLLEPKIPQGRLHRVRLYESPDLFADCYRNGDGSGRNGSAS